jgi:topoisomerase-4 subunit A
MKQTLLSGFQLQRYIKPVRAMKCNDDELVSVDMIKDPLEIMVFTRNAEALRFRASDISLYGTNAGGVKSINLKNGDYVVSAIYCNKMDDFLLLTNRSTIKRMKVEDVLLTKRSRSGNPVIKKLKSNPYLLVDAKKMTPNQYKENVKIYLMYKNGNDEIDAFSMKYNVSDCGKQLTPSDPSLVELTGMELPDPKKPDDAVSPEYLVEVRADLFSQDFGIEEETPMITSKKNSSQGIFDELDEILAKESGKTINDSIDESEDEEKKEIKYKKISLFDEE